jgi:CheY-like chemotaxis protein
MDTILVVEDERILREMIVEGLRRRGYEVLIAGDGHEAVRICAKRHKPIHVMLCDAMMPGLRPRELIRIAVEMYPSLIVLIMTAYAEKYFLPTGNSEGYHFIQKPFTSSELAARLAAILGGACA